MRKALSELELKTDQKTARGQQVATRLHKAQMNTVGFSKMRREKSGLLWSALKRKIGYARMREKG